MGSSPQPGNSGTGPPKRPSRPHRPNVRARRVAAARAVVQEEVVVVLADQRLGAGAHPELFEGDPLRFLLADLRPLLSGHRRLSPASRNALQNTPVLHDLRQVVH